jgi:hypothetical protein
MNIVELTNAELFKDLTTVDAGEALFDLHNNYVCTNIDYKPETKSLFFLFEATMADAEKKHLCLLFENVTFSTFRLFLKRTADSSRLDSFYRGRYEKDGALFEHAPTGETYFYLEFIEEDSFEIFSSKVSLLEIDKPADKETL